MRTFQRHWHDLANNRVPPELIADSTAIRAAQREGLNRKTKRVKSVLP